MARSVGASGPTEDPCTVRLHSGFLPLWTPKYPDTSAAGHKMEVQNSYQPPHLGYLKSSLVCTMVTLQSQQFGSSPLESATQPDWLMASTHTLHPLCRPLHKTFGSSNICTHCMVDQAICTSAVHLVTAQTGCHSFLPLPWHWHEEGRKEGRKEGRDDYRHYGLVP